MVLQETCCGHVSAEHAFLNQLVRIVALGWLDFRNLAPCTENNAGFLRLEIDCPAGMARLEQYLLQRVELLEMRQHLTVLTYEALTFG